MYLQVKKLGFGLMRLPLLNPNDGSSIDIELTKKMVDTFWKKDLHILIQRGCTGGFKSEECS